MIVVGRNSEISWQNWAGNVRGGRAAVLYPRTLKDVREIFQNANDGGIKLRFAGSGHSGSPLVPPGYENGWIVDTRFLRVDPPISLDYKTGLATVSGPLAIARLFKILAAAGWNFPNHGDSKCQTVAGALSTGTHGSAMNFGSYGHESVLIGLTLVFPNGETRNLNASRDSDRALLEAARLNLGLLGFVQDVTVQLERYTNLKLVGKKASLQEVLGAKPWENFQHCEVAYFPFRDSVGGKDLSCIVFTRERTEEPALSGVSIGMMRAISDIGENELAGILLGAASLYPSLVPLMSNTFYRTLPRAVSDVNEAYRIATKRRNTPVRLSEWAIPIENLELAFGVFWEVVHSFAKRGIYFSNLPAQVRFEEGPKKVLLSPTLGRKVCWFGFGSHPNHPGWEEFIEVLGREFIRLDGLPHWGKEFPETLGPDIRARYERDGKRIAEFEGVRMACDPNGILLNRMLESILTGTHP